MAQSRNFSIRFTAEQLDLLNEYCAASKVELAEHVRRSAVLAAGGKEELAAAMPRGGRPRLLTAKKPAPKKVPRKAKKL